jgi:tRNA modification GTPase
MLGDTIIALSTPPGFGGLGVIRLSGSQAKAIALKIFRPSTERSRFPSRRPILGHVFDSKKKEAFEEAIMTFYPAPQTYTREEMVEISCHGSPVVLEEVIRLGMEEGARLADPGEFTLRAYLHGRIDILQAEAINDLIHASSLTQARISFRQLEGGLSQKINTLRRQIIHLLSSIEASLEFPDDELGHQSISYLEILDEVKQTVQSLVDSYSLGRTYAEGLTVVLAGRTNVGKSTLFNALLEKDRSIVTPLPGTTRDYLQERLKIKDAVFLLTDMAGWEKTSQPAEQEGIAKGKRLAQEADGVLILLDASKKITNEDLRLIEQFPDKRKILLFNKTDLLRKMDTASFKKKHKGIPSLDISALTGKNIQKLKEAMHSHFIPSRNRAKDIILHLRQQLALESILSSLKEGERLLREGYPEEIFSEEVRKTIPKIGELTGNIRSEEIINAVFSRFCVGK